MFIPLKDTVLEMSSIDFEKYALQVLKSKIKGLENVKFIHNKIIEAYTEIINWTDILNLR